MSLFNDIIGAVGHRPTSGVDRPTTTRQQPGVPTAAERLHARFGGVFQSTFNSSMATVFERGAAGEFDDPTLRLQEQAALERLRIAQQAAGVSRQVRGDAQTTRVDATMPDMQGANAAPDAQGANPAPDAPASGAPVALAEQRELYGLRVRQSEARLANISVTLARDFPKAAALSSASTGSWDPETFVPRNRAEVEAFAHRMVIDATEAAARLEIVKTHLDAARLESAHGGGRGVQELVDQLEASYGRQKAYVDKLARIVDEQSGGQVSDAGLQALHGRTLRGAGDIPVQELAAELRASGMDERQVRRLIGAGELGVEQEKTPGGSERLRAIAADMTATMLARYNHVREQHRDEFRRQEQQRSDERRQLQRTTEQRRIEHDRLARHHEERLSVDARQQQSVTVQAREQRAAERDARFEQWLATLAAARDGQRRAS